MRAPPGTAVTVAVLLALAGASGAPAEDRDARRRALVAEVERDVRATGSHLGFAALDPRVAGAMLRVPRHRFVPEDVRSRAYENRPLPIGHGQTISQPYIVAVMTQLLGVGPGARVLEIGTGSGYQAAVLAELGAQVRSIEIVEALGRRAEADLAAAGYDGVRVRIGDGYFGWEEEAPFDGIIVTAAAGHVPPPLLRQLRPGGRLVIPVGGPWTTQQLVVVAKSAGGELTTRQVLPVRFVPLTGGH